MDVSLIIPCFNEAKNLPFLIERLKNSFANQPEIEIILVDNGSTDETPAVLAKCPPNIQSIRVPENQGYGHGILSGLKAAKGEYLAWTHADMQCDPADLLKGLALIKESENPKRCFVKGRRINRPVSDVFFTIGMAFFESILMGKAFWDINAQPVIFHRDFYQQWRSPPKDFSLDLYAYYQAKCHKLKVLRFPVVFGERLYGQSHWNIDWSSKWRFIKRTWAYSLALRFNTDSAKS